jgi:pimeloyl-ACP methyl ester carboxylesterase
MLSPEQQLPPEHRRVGAGAVSPAGEAEMESPWSVEEAVPPEPGFSPRSSAQLAIEPSARADDLDLVAAFAEALPTAAVVGADAETLRRIQPYRASTALGPHNRVWDIHCWALPAAVSASTAPVALCMHGHGHSCCVTSWAAFFGPLHDAGYNIIALDAPCFGRSGGASRESGQANLWRADDASLVLRLLQSFGVASQSQRTTAFAQCMGGAMFLRALHMAPGFFGAFHVMSNTTIGNFPPDIAEILQRKGGALLAYHEFDPDHMREAVAYKALTKLSEASPKLCRFIDNERARAASLPHVLDSDHMRVTVAPGAQLSRDRDAECFFFQPSAYVLDKIMRHVTRVAVPQVAPSSVEHPIQSAVALGQADSASFTVAVRVRPPLARERMHRRSYTVQTQPLPGSCDTGEEITVQTSIGGRTVDKAFLFHRVFGESDGNATVYAELARPLLDFVLARSAPQLQRGTKRSGGRSGERSATIFAYGQTGSGKTYTVSGDDGTGGVVSRLVTELYERCSDSEGAGARSISATYVQLYNDELSELLGGPGRAGRRVRFREVSEGNGAAVELADALVVQPRSAKELLDMLADAALYRATGATQMNEVSSRSHALLTLRVCPSGDEPADQQCGVFHVVDLAGSERVKRSGAVGGQLAEATAINSSLFALARVVNALTQQQEDDAGRLIPMKAAHVPYRGSILTRLLANALGGNSRTALVACVSPAEDSAEETHSTLGFAARATFVKNDVEGTEPEPEPELSVDAVKALDASAAAIDAKNPFSNSTCSCTVDFGTVARPSAATKQVEVFGDFDAGPSAPVVVCLHYYGHGSPGGRQFVEWFSALRDAGYRVLAPSFPGHGNTAGSVSSKPEPEVLAGVPAAFLTALLDHFGVKTCVLFGHDWGGGVAWEYAARFPQRVAAVIGHSISYRGAESSLAVLQKRYAPTQGRKRMLLCWMESEVHLKKKGLALAKGAGVKLRLCDSSDAVLGHAIQFLGKLKLDA